MGQPDNGTASGPEPDQNDDHASDQDWRRDREPPVAGMPGESNTAAMPDVHTRDAAVSRREDTDGAADVAGADE